MPVAVAGVGGELAAFMLSVLVEMYVAQVHSGGSRGTTEINVVRPRHCLNVPRGLRTKPLAIGALGQIGTLFGDHCD